MPRSGALVAALRRFAARRDWDQFHTPKNLAMGLCVEAAELAEIFLWLTPEQSGRLAPRQRRRLQEELADVYLYLVRLADRCGIDLERAARAKLRRNARKYPVAKARGSARKYTEFR